MVLSCLQQGACALIARYIYAWFKVLIHAAFLFVVALSATENGQLSLIGDDEFCL